MGGKTVTKEMFIARAKNKHGDIYDYSSVNYTNSKSRVTIYCQKHNNYFTQVASEHFIYSGCKFCRVDKCKSTHIKNRERVKPLISRFIKKHGNKYNYSKVDFLNIGIDDKAIIVCPEHGEFEQQMFVHLSCGCPKCGRVSRIKKKTKKVDSFILKARNKHKELYDYSNINYVNLTTNIQIICRKHNYIFSITPKEHLNTCYGGCKLCLKDSHGSIGEMQIKKWLEDNSINFELEKTFDTCKIKHFLRFDFYLKDYNLLIEFDGEQHFKCMRWSKNKSKNIEKFKKVKKRDVFKNKWAKENNYNLLRIPYTNIKNIDKILNSTLRGKNELC